MVNHALERLADYRRAAGVALNARLKTGESGLILKLCNTVPSLFFGGRRMAGAKAAGFLGWVVAGLACVALLGQCMGMSSNDHSAPLVMRPEERASSWLYVHAASLHCRVEPTSSATSVERLSRNDMVGVIRNESGWALLDREADCWASAAYLGPQREAAPERQVRSLASTAPRRQARSAYYANCSEARAAGAAPVYSSDPGYARRLDRDGDGVGCE